MFIHKWQTSGAIRVSFSGVTNQQLRGLCITRSHTAAEHGDNPQFRPREKGTVLGSHKSKQRRTGRSLNDLSHGM